MKEIADAITSEYLSYGINEDISIYEGRFCIYLDKKYRCNGKIYYKMTPPISISFKADIGCVEEIDNEDDNLALDYDNAILEVHGYKIISITINTLSEFSVEGYINDDCIKSKNSYVEYVDFNIINLDKIPGKLIKYNDKVYAGRIEFDINDYVVTIDKRYDYRKELKSELKSKSGAIITHIGRIRRKDGRIFRTNNTINLLDRISTALSFMCGRYVGFCLAKGYRSGNEVYRIWNENQISPFRYVPTWSDTLSNYHNMEKYISLMCKKLEDFYYGSAIKSVVDWYIESLGSATMENNIISVQIALETLSYVILVEQNKILTDEVFDCNLASKNIRLLLDTCKIPYGKHELNIFDNIIKNKFDDGVDLVIYLRNSIVHPSRKTHRAVLEVEDIWNIISIGTRYIELVLLFILGYRGEYSNRLVERCYGEVEVVPWN
ncbi:TPA: hypothetical protein KN209_002367 [Clostridioides difficile]|uniref:Uncharacterized protein n=5 Tax=Clostridioides difficile TaxID=1496 RepID=A0AC59FZG5_CLODI|nr:hypothetical protein [Clostridioides difficile]OFU07610.1 hypothetical protein HMPREF3080_15015 [Clostridium sp. HMSC19C11]OFU24019.1 hypothetical protein HMPREF3076_17590 [Clostridium sp. HMSC19B12]CCL64726.1 Conserved hypothetical protein [Clostridioides difficile E7]HDN2472407.1 hypothetical protein [Clostridioides difficile CD196]AKP42731.1 hypothetical protein CDIF1296T_01871 [Clostridioides difficile ATCC 9689 = DSM 1296]